MKDFEKVQTEVDIQPNQKETSENKDTCFKDEKEINFGKFANAQALLLAYQNLEREFTKKSQQLKQIQKQLSCDNGKVCSDEKTLPPQAEDTDNSALQNPDLSEKHVDNPAQANVILPDQLVSDKEFLEKHVFANPDVTNQVLQRYFSTLLQKKD